MTTRINTEYESFLNVYNINFPEIEENILSRVYNFIHKLESDKKLKNKTILFVTHMSTINAIKSYITPTDLEADFHMGKMEQII